MARLCHTGAAHRCFGPWWMCAMFGCAVNNPRPHQNSTPRKAAEQAALDDIVEARRQANISSLSAKKYWPVRDR